MKKLTQHKVQKLLNYDQNTGLVYWRVRGIGRPVNRPAGSGCGIGYRKIRIENKDYILHRIIFLYMTGRLPRFEVDHINGIRDDNRWSNLREVTCQENRRNAAIPNRNKSGVLGVHWCNTVQKWIARITIDRKIIYIGSFHSLKNAAITRKKAERKYGFHKNHGRKLEDRHALV